MSVALRHNADMDQKPPAVTPPTAQGPTRHIAERTLESRVWRLLGEGDTRGALAACQQLNRQYPRFAPGWYSASQLAARLNNPEMALRAIERALRLEPDKPAWQLQQAYCLMQRGQVAQARPLLLKLDALDLASGYQCSTLGLLLSRIERHEQALRHYLRAIELEPDQAEHYYNLATLQRFLGNTDAAEDALADALSRNPADAEARKLRSELRRQTPARNNIEDLERALTAASDQPRSRVQLHYALAKELEDLGRWRESFEQLHRGADLRRRHMRYEVAGDLDTMAAIVGAYDGQMFDGHIRGDPDQRPIFIVGMPRTGTTLVERILGSHSQVHAAGELNHFALEMSGLAADSGREGERKKVSKQRRVELSTQIDFGELGARYIASTETLTAGYPRFIDKMPLNFLYAGLIHLALPNARIIHLRRHPLDTCYAVYKTLFADAYPFSYQLEELGRYYAAYRWLMDHWNAVMPGVIHEVSYEELVAGQEQHSRALLAACDLPWEDQCLRFHENRAASTTASASQVREPMYHSSVGKWRRFAAELAPLIEVLRAEGIDPRLG